MIRFKMNPKKRHEEIVAEPYEKITEEQGKQLYQLIEDACLPLWAFQNLLALDGSGSKADFSDVLKVLLSDMSEKIYDGLEKMEVRHD